MNNEAKILTILDRIEGDISTIKEDVSVLKEDVTSLNGRMRNVENRLIVIENDHGKKLTTLFDGYTQLYDITNEIREDVKELKEGRERHDLEIHALKRAGK